ncbi:MAG: hypothetical protein U1A78_23105 [Polyangia bacterium]
MRSTASPPILWGLVSLFLTAPLIPAHAATAPLTMLPLLRDGRPSEALTQGTVERLQRLGEEPEPARGALSPAEQSCETSSCLGALAQRLRAARIVGGSVSASGQRRYMAKLFLYDRGSGRIHSEDGACEDCSERQLGALVSSLAAKLIEMAPSGVRPVVLPPSPPRPVEPAPVPAAPSERRLGELAEALRAQGPALGKAREAAETAARTTEASSRTLEGVRVNLDRMRDSQDRLRDSQDKLRDSQDKLREATDKTRDLVDKTRASTEKLRTEVERSRDSSDKARESSEKARESAERTRELAERGRASAERARELGQSTQTTVERLRETVDKARESVESGRGVTEATRLQVEKLAVVTERAATTAEAARAESVQARESAAQTGLIAGKALQSVEQLNGLSGDLRSALSNVEPLRAAAEQTRQTAGANATTSTELLKLAEAQRTAAGDTLLRAEQTLRLVKEQDARRGLSRGRKVAAGILGGLTALALGGAVTMSALDGAYYGDCRYAGATRPGCVLNLSPGYASIGYALSALLGASTVAVLAVPASAEK